MLEAQQLRSALEQQRQCLNVDNSETIRHIDGLVARIGKCLGIDFARFKVVSAEKCHTIEKQRWANQRLTLNVAAKVATFLRDCKELRHQLLVGTTYVHMTDHTNKVLWIIYNAIFYTDIWAKMFLFCLHC